MNWAWATSLDQIWPSSSFPMWLMLAAGFFVIVITLLRAEKSVATGALTVITLLAIGLAVASTLRGQGTSMRGAAENAPPPVVAGLPALSCIEDIAGDAVGQACEKVLFGSAESTAAAVNYMAAMITRLTARGDAATAQRTMTAEMQALRRAVERDRYGLVAQVLLARDRCTPMECAAYRSLTDNHQIITNMDEHTYDALVARYAPSWNAPPPVATAAAIPGALLGSSMPTGRPTNAEFPSAANTPAVSIMTPEPGTGTGTAQTGSRPPPTSTGATGTGARPAQTATSPAPSSTPAPAAKKQTAAKKNAPGAPVQISPGSQAPAASED